MTNKIIRGNIKSLLLAYCLLLAVFSGCGEHVTGTNAELDAAHTGGPDCTQSGCHPGFGAGGTVFESVASATPASGATIKLQPIEGKEITLVTDNLGNFHYDQELSGYYNIVIDNNEGSSHILPEWKGCNRCHKWPNPDAEAEGRLF